MHKQLNLHNICFSKQHLKKYPQYNDYTALNTAIPTMVFRPSRPCLQHQRRTALAPPSIETSAAEQTDPVNGNQTIRTFYAQMP